MGTVLVIGVRGKTGRQVAEALRSHGGVRVHGAGRSLGDDAQALGVDEAVGFDWNDEASWPDAVQGVDAIYLVKPRTPDPAATVLSFLGGLRGTRVVLLSEVGAGSRDDGATERAVEKVVEASGLEFVLLRLNWFMQNFVEPSFYLDDIREKAQLRLPTAGQATSFVDTRDIGEAAATCLLEAEYSGRAFTITGPQALTWHEVSSLVSAAAGYEVSYLDVPLEDYLNELADAGTSATGVAYWGRVLREVCSGGTALVTKDVEQLTGHVPRSFQDFVNESASLWRREH